ncbi:hypothetical protein HID58_011620 [Brassica napus]|uniref:Senescence domain-containing protein n=2 Tax=Brassica napus TaxID=3708 RepID=A0ABQ8DZ66_BRANA|nr:hypothetical protein HID58_011620 [Brassica napus]
MKDEDLLQIPGCIVHLANASEPLELASGEFKLVRDSSDDNVALALLVRVGLELQWPVVKDEPMVKVSAHDYLFTLPDKDGDSLGYKVTFSDEEGGVFKKLEILEELMREHSCFSSLSKNKNEIDWKEFSPKAEEYKNVVAKAIAEGTGHIIKGIFICSNSFSKMVQKVGSEITITKETGEKSGHDTEINGGDNNRTPKNNNIITITNIARVETLWEASEMIGAMVLDGEGMISGLIMAPVVKSKLGKALLSTAPGEILLASLDSFDKILGAAEAAEIQTHFATSMAATKLVSKRKSARNNRQFGPHLNRFIEPTQTVQSPPPPKYITSRQDRISRACLVQSDIEPLMNLSNLPTPHPSLPVNLIPKLPIRHLTPPIIGRSFAIPKLLLHGTPAAKRVFWVRATVDGDGEKTGNWVNRLPIPGLGAENVFRLISSATGSPIGQFISSPVTFLHSVDPRIKLVWLLTLVVLPARANIVVRLGLVVCTALLSISVLPRQVWMDQLARVSLLSGILFITLGLGSDGAPPMLQSRTPPSSLTGLPDLPMSLTGYSYMLLKLGSLQFTRKGLSVGSTAACLTFIIFQSASICLATTTPEQLALAMRWFLFPLTYIGVPVGEIILTLLLSLRFINLVFDEVRSVALGIVSRRVDWKQLTVLETLDIFASFIRRIFKNIFRHAEQISQAMIVRGFRGESSSHKIYFFSGSSNKFADFASVLGLIGVISTALLSEYLFV